MASIASMDMDAHSMGMQDKFSDQISKTEEYPLRRTREEYIGCVAEMFSWSKQGFSVVGQCGKGSENTFPVVGTGQQWHGEQGKAWEAVTDRHMRNEKCVRVAVIQKVKARFRKSTHYTHPSALCSVYAQGSLWERCCFHTRAQQSKVRAKHIATPRNSCPQRPCNNSRRHVTNQEKHIMVNTEKKKLRRGAERPKGNGMC